MVKDNINKNTVQVALFVALACVLQISESLIPHPIPGLRLGLANILTLTALVTLGFRYALEITILRTILSSFITGTFMSPGFILSFSGAIISTLIMGLLLNVSSLRIRNGLSIIGISIVGAFSHNMIQLFLAYFILIKHDGIFIFFPWLSAGAVIMGYMVGIVARGVCRNLEKAEVIDGGEITPSNTPGQLMTLYVSGNSILHRLPAHMKLMAVIVLSLTILFTEDFRLYLFLFGFLAGAALLSRTPAEYLFKGIIRYKFLILFSFLLPLLFNSGSKVIVTFAHFDITHEGVTAGTLFASRIVYLILASTLLIRTTSPEEMTKGLAIILSPLKYAGISPQRIALILSQSWAAIPFLWVTVREAMFSNDLGKKNKYRDLVPRLSKLIAVLYTEAERGEKLW